MANFDQRNQKVKHQFNAGGNINFSLAENKAELIREFRKLHNELNSASTKNLLDGDLSAMVDAKIKNVIDQIDSSKPDKNSTLKHLQEAKELIGGIASATGLIKLLAEAVEVVRRLF